MNHNFFSLAPIGGEGRGEGVFGIRVYPCPFVVEQRLLG